MKELTSQSQGWLKKRIIPISVVLLAVAITVVLFILRDEIAALENYGYLGAFLVCLFSNMSVILPVPGIVVLFVLGANLNPILVALGPLVLNLTPVLVALAGATGGTIGEITGYMAGYGGRGMVQDRGPMYARAENWMRKWGGWTIFVFAVFPIPIIDIAGVVAGALRYPLWKFLLIAWPGKSVKYIIIVLAGAYGWQALLRFLG